MRWQGRRRSDNVEDRRGARPGGIALGGGGLLLVLILSAVFGINPVTLLNQLGGESMTTSAPAIEPAPGSGAPDEAHEFVSVVLAETETVWREQFAAMGEEYREPHLVLFSGRVESACGLAGSAVGPFYCPGDSRVYLDLSFYEELRDRFGAGGDFAEAYVIAHEVGHHVQNLLGASERVARMRERLSKEDYNRLSVRLELQADFYAGVWAHHAARTAGLLEPGDIEEALRAASAIGDDRLQMQAQGHVVPDAFTHGTSEQRVRWFRRGYETGDPRQGDTFSARSL